MKTFYGDHFLVREQPLKVSGFSRVHQATDFRTGEQVVLKRLSFSGQNADEALKMWLREADALTGLEHPAIVRFIERFTLEQDLCLVLEYVPNRGSLALLIEEVEASRVSPPSLAWRLAQLLRLFAAINAAHDKGVIHRDLNPNNILVTEGDDPTLVLIDFGVAKLVDPMTEGGGTLLYWLTPPYVAPEQVEEGRTLYESDYYLFGMVAVSLLTLKPLKRRPEPADVPALLAPLTGELFDDRLQAELSDLLAGLLARNPGERPRPANVSAVLVRVLDRATLRPVVDITFSRQARLKLQQEGIDIPAYLEDLNAQPAGKLQQDDSVLLLGKGVKTVLRETEPGSDVWQVVDAYRERPAKQERLRRTAHRLPYQFKEGRTPAEAFTTFLTNHYHTELSERNNREARSHLFSNAEFILEKQVAWDRTVRIKYGFVGNTAERPKRRNRERKRIAVPAHQQFTLKVGGVTADRYAAAEDEVEEFNLEALLQEQGVVLYQSEGRAQKKVGEPVRYDPSEGLLTLHPDTNLSLPRSGELITFNVAARASISRQRDALKRFVEGRTASSAVTAQLLDPTLVRTSKDVLVELIQPLEPKGEMRDLVERMVNAEVFFLLQGPPGTGKTTMIAELIAQLLERNPKARILLTSQANQAVDNALERVGELRTQQGAEWRLVRDTRDRTSTESDAYFEPTYRRFCDQAVRRSKQAETTRSAAFTPEVRRGVHRALEKWRGSLNSAQEVRDAFLSTVQLHGATCLRVPEVQRQRQDQPFDWVVIDEAAKTLDTEVLIPLVHARRAILVGDQAQLKPYIDRRMEAALKDAKRKDYDVSLFERLFGRVSNHCRSALTVQFRMHRSIGAFVGELFYQHLPGGLKTGVSDDAREIYVPSLAGENRVLWCDVRGNEKREGNSYVNHAEELSIFRLLREINEGAALHGVRYTVSVITPYRAQVRRLRSVVLYNRTSLGHLDIEVATVDSFQGKQTDITLYSLVRTSPWGLRFPARDDRLNVSFSRAKLALVIFGDLENAKNDPLLNRARSLVPVVRREVA